jgi:hypothetical protein
MSEQSLSTLRVKPAHYTISILASCVPQLQFPLPRIHFCSLAVFLLEVTLVTSSTQVKIQVV